MKSINEPENSGRDTMLTPMSINEPLTKEQLEDAIEDHLPPLELEALVPNEAMIGGDDIEMHLVGGGFTKQCVINFNGGDEPTNYVSDTDIWTIVKPSTASVPGSYPVYVRRSMEQSDAHDFTFVEAPASARKAKGR